jgi:putative membrane protein
MEGLSNSPGRRTNAEDSDMPSDEGTWKAALAASPGPDSWQDAFVLTLKGMCMGTADIIPGVSGGTIALITGIYHQLLKAIKSADLSALRLVLSGRIQEAVSRVHLRFLVSLFAGISIAIVSLARLMNYLLHQHPVPVWSLFFGLVAASVLVVGRSITSWRKRHVAALAAGTLAAYAIVSSIPVATPNTPLFIFGAGVIAICAMILPGISGAFILLILGKYEFVTGALKNPFLLSNTLVIIVFCAGCLVGLLSFSRVLNYLLNVRYHTTVAFLTGLMIGSLPKLWPWKRVVESAVIRGKTHVITTANVLPDALTGEVLAAAALAITGAAAVVLLDRISKSYR